MSLASSSRESNLAWVWMEQKAARPKNGRLLQNLLAIWHAGFVAAILSRVFRDGMGRFVA